MTNYEELQTICNYIITKCDCLQEEGLDDRMSVNRLQKLLYFCDVEFMKKNGQSMIAMNYLKFPHGPAIECLYHNYILVSLTSRGPGSLWNDRKPLQENKKKMIDFTIGKINHLSTEELNDMAKQIYLKFDDVKLGQIIKKSKILEFYAGRDILDEKHIQKAEIETFFDIAKTAMQKKFNQNDDEIQK